MKQKNKVLFSLLLITALSLTSFVGCGGGGGGGGDADGPETLVLRYASEVLEANIMYDLNYWICDEIEKRTDGRIKINFYPAAQLGEYDTVFEEVMIGSIDMAQSWIPEFYDSRVGVVNIPAASRNFEETKLLYAPDRYVFKTLDGILEGLNIKLLGITIEGFENIASVKAVTDPFVPGAPKNTRLRVPPFEVDRLWMEAMGYEAMTISWGEVPTSLQTGIVDAWAGGNLMYHYGYTGDIIKYSYVANSHPDATSIIINLELWDSLSPEERKIFSDVSTEAARMCADMGEGKQEEFADRLRERGVDVVYATPTELVEIAKFKRENVWPKYESILTKDIMDGLKAELQDLGLW